MGPLAGTVITPSSGPDCFCSLLLPYSTPCSCLCLHPNVPGNKWTHSRPFQNLEPKSSREHQPNCWDIPAQHLFPRTKT